MTIEAVLETKWKPETSTTSETKIKAGLLVHCSCGHDYKIEEIFPAERIGKLSSSYVRPTECPECKEKDFLIHTTQRPLAEVFSYAVKTIDPNKR